MAIASDATWTSGRGPRLVQIGLSTFGILALELALIRWTAGQIRLVAYFNSLVLIGAFLGMGLGLALGEKWPGLVHLVLPALALLAIPVAFAPELGLLKLKLPDPSSVVWGPAATLDSALGFLASAGALLLAFAAVAAVFALAGAALGHLLGERTGLQGYSADLLGSIAGVAALSLVTALGATPPVWLALGALPFAWLSRRVVSLVALVAVVLLGQLSVRGAIFSPYNRIDLTQTEMGTTLSVNRSFYQYMLDLSDASLARNPDKRPLRQLYDTPYAVAAHRGSALIVGAGSGNDVQAALRHGFGKVVSVDIDPRIMELGRKMHPERPYDDPRVVPVVNDGRAFFEQYEGPPFDVVAFGFVDSRTMFTAVSSLKLDNYLYTEEGLRAAYRLVAPGGSMTVSLTLVGGPWIRDRIYWTLHRATGVHPISVPHGIYAGATFIVPRGDPSGLKLDHLAGMPVHRPTAPPAADVSTTSDDWPFLYVDIKRRSWAYLVVLGAALLLTALASLAVFGRRRLIGGFDPPLFLMGAAFLLLETRGVTSLALLFGSTWVVNTAVFTGVLVMALAANLWVIRRPPRSAVVPFLLLFAALVVVYLVPNGALNRLPLVARGLGGGLVNALPIGFAGLVVSIMLARSRNLPAALGSNLVGAVLGGCIEYLSMEVGLRALVALAFVLYLGAFLAERLAAPWRGGCPPPGDASAPDRRRLSAGAEAERIAGVHHAARRRELPLERLLAHALARLLEVGRRLLDDHAERRAVGADREREHDVAVRVRLRRDARLDLGAVRVDRLLDHPRVDAGRARVADAPRRQADTVRFTQATPAPPA